MPYKNRDDRLAYYQRHQKHYMKAWRVMNRDAWNEYQKEYKRQNYKTPKPTEESRAWSRKYRAANRLKLNRYHVHKSAILSDDYIVKQLNKESGCSYEYLRLQPKLIQAKRICLLIKREIRNANKN